MIYIEKEALNKIFVDVSAAELGSPFFLWNLKNSQGMNVKNFIPRDITATYPSQYAGKYNVFEFSTFTALPENLTPVGTSVVNIHLPNLNQFWLGIYEQANITNLNPTNSDWVLNSLAFSFWDSSSQYYSGNTGNTADNVIYYNNVSPSLTPTPSITPTPTPTPSPCPVNPILQVMITDCDATDFGFELQQTDTSAYSSPGTIDVDMTWNLDDGNDLNHTITLPAGQSYISFNYLTITGGREITGYTMNTISNVPYCWTILPTNRWVLRRCDTGAIYASPAVIPTGYENNIFKVGIGDVCVYTDGRYYAQSGYGNTLVDIQTETFYNDCAECLTP